MPKIYTYVELASNINMAIDACRPESGRLLHNRQEMTQVKETLDDGYCDVSGRIGNLNYTGALDSFYIVCFSYFLGIMGSVKVYLSPGEKYRLAIKCMP
jgi:hypothetical protein